MTKDEEKLFLVLGRAVWQGIQELQKIPKDAHQVAFAQRKISLPEAGDVHVLVTLQSEVAEVLIAGVSDMFTREPSTPKSEVN